MAYQKHLQTKQINQRSQTIQLNIFFVVTLPYDCRFQSFSNFFIHWTSSRIILADEHLVLISLSPQFLSRKRSNFFKKSLFFETYIKLMIPRWPLKTITQATGWTPLFYVIQ